MTDDVGRARRHIRQVREWLIACLLYLWLLHEWYIADLFNVQLYRNK